MALVADDYAAALLPLFLHLINRPIPGMMMVALSHCQLSAIQDLILYKKSALTPSLTGYSDSAR